MSTAAISSSSIYQQTEQYFQTRQSDVQQLGQALQSGDLAGAQAAFGTLQSTFQKGPGTQNSSGSGSTSGNGPEIVLNLSNNSSTASSASSAPASSNGPEIVLNLGNSSGANAEQITINLNPTSGGGEEVSLSVGSQGSNAQEITFDLAPNSNEQIVLNLLNESSSTPTGSSSSSSSANGGLSVTA
jgi:hypothetical protein